MIENPNVLLYSDVLTGIYDDEEKLVADQFDELPIAAIKLLNMPDDPLIGALDSIVIIDDLIQISIKNINFDLAFKSLSATQSLGIIMTYNDSVVEFRTGNIIKKSIEYIDIEAKECIVHFDVQKL